MNKIIVANQKNVLNYDEVQTFLEEIEGKIPKENVIFCPSYPYIVDYVKRGYKVASQDVSSRKDVVTGEVTALMLSHLFVQYALVGHTERILYKQETEEDLVNKIQALMSSKITPLLCIGELLEEDFEDVKKRLKRIYDKISLYAQEKIILCYEPFDAIGTKKQIDIQNLETKINSFKEFISLEYHIKPKILYGGSVSEDNIKDILSITNIDGVCVGRESTKSSLFLKLIEVAVTM